MIVENATDRQLKIRENKLLKTPLLRLDGLEKEKFKRRKPIQGLEFIINQQFGKHTYNIDDDNMYQCRPNCRRSAGDLFLLMKYYYPNITFKEVRQLLFDLINNRKLNCSLCTNIGKRVYWKESLRGEGDIWRGGEIWNDGEKDELGFILKEI